MKPDSLVIVEENSSESNKPSSSGIGITTGTVDWATPTWSLAESKAQVRVEDTKAQLGSNSRGAVKADPENKSSEVMVSSGSAQVQRGQERVDLSQYEKATIPSGGAIQKSNVLAPPDLVAPLNLAPVILENPKTSPVRFEWKPVLDAVSYTLRISTTAMFTKTVKDAKVSGTAVEITGLDPGDYFWNVTATDGKKQTSEVSTIFKFTLVAQGKSQEMVLEITSTQVVGHSAEIVGRTEPGAALIVNGQSVPNIAPDLGTANPLVFAHGKGIVVNEPSIVAINKATGEVVAVGREAKEMLGRTPGNVVAIKPMKDGVIADFKVTEKMLTYFIQKAHNRRVLVHPRIVIGVPSEITPVEKRAVQDSAYRARATDGHHRRQRDSRSPQRMCRNHS